MAAVILLIIAGVIYVAIAALLVASQWTIGWRQDGDPLSLIMVVGAPIWPVTIACIFAAAGLDRLLRRA